MHSPQTAPRPMFLYSLFINSLHFAALKKLSRSVDQSLPLIAPLGHFSLQMLQCVQGFGGNSVGFSNSQSVKTVPRRTFAPYSLCKNRQLLPILPSPARQAVFFETDDYCKNKRTGQNLSFFVWGE